MTGHLASFFLNPEAIAPFYQAFGRDAVKRMMTPPEKPLIARADKNGDDPKEILAKRDAAVEAVLTFIEEYINLDND